MTERRRLYKELGGAARVRNARSSNFDYRSESESGEEEEHSADPPSDPPRDWDPGVRWCYNCAAQGNHWGDDCPLPRCNPTYIKGDPSAYSEFMASMGPHSRYLPPPPPPDRDAYRAGLRRYDEPYDRFQAGPKSSMHVYDPQREAMASVDQLFDRHGPGASRRRDAERRRGGGYQDHDAPGPKPVVHRKSGQGSKADRYRETNQDPRDRRAQGRPDQVSSNGGPAACSRVIDNESAKTEIRARERAVVDREAIVVSDSEDEPERGVNPKGTGKRKGDALLEAERPTMKGAKEEQSKKHAVKTKKRGTALERAKEGREEKERERRRGEEWQVEEKQREEEARGEQASLKGGTRLERKQNLLHEERQKLAQARVDGKQSDKQMKAMERVIADLEQSIWKKREAAERAKEIKEEQKMARWAKKDESDMRKRKREEATRARREEAARVKEKARADAAAEAALSAKTREERRTKVAAKEAKKAEGKRAKKRENIAIAREAHEQALAQLQAKGDMVTHAKRAKAWRKSESVWREKGLLV
jgi:hypothetical protein